MSQQSAPPARLIRGNKQTGKTVVIKGAGLVGLTAGAHALERGLAP